MKRNRATLEAIGDTSSASNGDLEHWQVRKRLVAHDNDVQDMAWAPDGSILVSVGLDRSIVVWSGMTFEKIKRFDIHQSHVKGVTFDPAGKYFITYSDDRSMRVFNYKKGLIDSEMTFQVESIIRKPFEKSPISTTYFRRCSWSPDGLYIAAPNGMNNGINSNMIIKRGTWELDVSLIGHKLPCEVCCFSPRLYQVSDDKVDTILVSAGQDRSIAIWSTNCSTPLAVITDISPKSITDIAWSSSGLEFFVCSLDGDVFVISFEDDELGDIVPWEDTFQALNKYGKQNELKFIKSYQMIELEQMAQKKFPNLFDNDNNVKTKNRIKELMEGETESLLHSSSLENSKQPESVNLLVGRSKKNPNKKMPTITPVKPVVLEAPKPVVNNINTLTLANQKVTITKSGKKRVTPMLITTEAPSKVVKPLINNKKVNNDTANKKFKYISYPTFPLPRNGMPSLVYGLVKTPQLELENRDDVDQNNVIDEIIETNDSIGTSTTPAIGRKRQRKHYTRLNENKIIRFDGKNPYWLEMDIINPNMMFGERNTQMEVQVEIKDSIDQSMEIRSFDDINKETDFDEDEDEFEEEFYSISKMINRSPLASNQLSSDKWDMFINDKLTSVDESKWLGIEYWVLGFDSGKMYVLSSNGKLICPIINLGSPIIKLIANQDQLCAITLDGNLNTWEIFNSKGQRLISKINEVSMAPLFNQYSANDESKRVSEIKVQTKRIKFRKGEVVVALSNNESFKYNVQLSCWTKEENEGTA